MINQFSSHEWKMDIFAICALLMALHYGIENLMSILGVHIPYPPAQTLIIAVINQKVTMRSVHRMQCNLIKRKYEFHQPHVRGNRFVVYDERKL